MGNGDRDPYERLWKLQASVGKLVLEGKRDPTDVADVLQGIIENPPGSMLSFITRGRLLGYGNNEYFVVRALTRSVTLRDIARAFIKRDDFANDERRFKWLISIGVAFSDVDTAMTALSCIKEHGRVYADFSKVFFIVVGRHDKPVLIRLGLDGVSVCQNVDMIENPTSIMDVGSILVTGT